MEKEVSHLNTGKSKLNKLHSKLKLKLQKYFLDPPPLPPNKIILQTPPSPEEYLDLRMNYNYARCPS